MAICTENTSVAVNSTYFVQSTILLESSSRINRKCRDAIGGEMGRSVTSSSAGQVLVLDPPTQLTFHGTLRPLALV